MARALCEAGLAGIAIVDILSEFGESAVKELHADYGLYVWGFPSFPFLSPLVPWGPEEF
jgi:hypothetical protein